MKKRLLMLLFLLLAGTISALDNEGWLNKAKQLASEGFMMDSDETSEDGVYCLVLAQINTRSGKTADAQIGEAVLDAKKKIGAFLKGEKVSASTSVETKRVTVSSGDEKITQSYKKFERRISSKVNALLRGVKAIGQISVGEKSYVVCITCEKFEQQTEILNKAMSEYGDDGVVVSIGEASTHDLAIQKAIRGAVEQVLGTVVIGYDKMKTGSDFQQKVFSGTDGVVEKYRILSETQITIGTRIEIVAKVSKKNLLDNYSNYMKFIGDPGFYIECKSPTLNSNFSDFFTEMGIRVVARPQDAKYVIVCTGVYRDLKHPIEDRRGVQLSLRFMVCESNGREILIDMKNDPRKSACFVGDDVERQMEICAGKAFKQMKKPLHEKIQAMVGKLVGRKMDEIANEDD